MLGSSPGSNPTIAGDLFDEGNWGEEAVLNEYARRFRSHFDTSTQTRVHVLFGNHDLGFHYE